MEDITALMSKSVMTLKNVNVFIRGVAVHLFILNHSVQDIRFGTPCDPNKYCQNSLFMSMYSHVEQKC